MMQRKPRPKPLPPFMKLAQPLGADLEKTPVTEHVRDGKPLTATGAKMLGVPWPPKTAISADA